MTLSPQPGKADAALTAAVSKLKRQIAELEARDETTAKKVADLGGQLSAIVTMLEEQKAKEEAAVPTAWNWSSMDSEEAADAWAALVTWRREWLRPRWPEQWGQMTMPCWYRHPNVVEELSVLYQTWRFAWEDPAARPRAQSDWIDRLHTVATRVARQLEHCGGTHHEPWTGYSGSMEPVDHDDEELSAWINADLTARPEPADDDR